MCIRFTGDRSGATAVEYAVVAGLVSLAMFASFHGFADATGALFDTVALAWPTR